jgi:short-subunit dehydrogenase
MATYCTSKFAGQGFSESLLIELASKGIQVTNVSPGPLRTGIYLASEYTGDAEKEIEWFGGQARFPLPAPFGPLSAENAAQLIVRAIKRGTQQIVIPPIPFDIIGRLHGLMPELSLAIRQWINNRMPAPTGNHEKVEGDDLMSCSDKPL